MNTWLRRSILAIVMVSLPLAGCAANASEGDGTQATTEALAASPAAKLGARKSVDAKFTQWLVTPHGKVAGMLLDDGSIAMIPPHAAKDVTKATLEPGDAVHVEGFARDGAQTYAFASVKKGGATIVEAKLPEGARFAAGQHGRDPQQAAERRARRGERRHAHPDDASLAPIDASGTVVALLLGRHGDTRGVVLSDGTVAYAKHDAKLGELVKKGDAIRVSGKGGAYDLGKALVIESVTLPSGETRAI